MRKVVKYVADDGYEFDNSEDCLVYEDFKQRAKALVDRYLKPRHETWDRAGVGSKPGYIQQDKENVIAFRKEFGQIAYEVTGKQNPEYIEDILDDKGEMIPFGDTILIKTTSGYDWRAGWFRLACIDRQYREYDQPFFANCPQEAAAQRAERIG